MSVAPSASTTPGIANDSSLRVMLHVGGAAGAASDPLRPTISSSRATQPSMAMYSSFCGRTVCTMWSM